MKLPGADGAWKILPLHPTGSSSSGFQGKKKTQKMLIFLEVKQNNQSLILSVVVATGHKPYLTSQGVFWDFLGAFFRPAHPPGFGCSFPGPEILPRGRAEQMSLQDSSFSCAFRGEKSAARIQLASYLCLHPHLGLTKAASALLGVVN